MPVGDLARADCHLFLWATGPCLPHALQVMTAWGFRYSALGFVWVKLNKRAPVLFWDSPSFFMGMGHTTRQNAELVLLGRRGSPKRKSKAVRQLLVAPRGVHSEKPEELQNRIEAYADGPYCELFARRVRPGWDCWGDELESANATGE